MFISLLILPLKNRQRMKAKWHETAFALFPPLVLWAIGILTILSNLGYDITALAASLGIGGIAVALAAQNILGDLFSSFSIYFDRPFQIGDFIIVGNDMGSVKK